MERKEEKAFIKLGFNQEETNNLVEHLNQILANYHIHYQKLRNFHWNVEGKDFFDLHVNFEEEYNIVQTRIDQVAERIRVFGKKPLSNLSDYLEVSNIKEVKNSIEPGEMVEEILNDFEILVSLLKKGLSVASNIGDPATEDMLTGFIRETEKKHWMFNAWLK